MVPAYDDNEVKLAAGVAILVLQPEMGKLISSVTRNIVNF